MQRPTLMEERDYYLSRAYDMDLPREEREQWLVLAEELTRWLVAEEPDKNQMELW